MKKVLQNRWDLPVSPQTLTAESCCKKGRFPDVYKRQDYARALAKLSREKAAFPDLSHEAVNSAFPGRSQGMIQVLSTADGQLNRLNQSGLK